MVTKYKLISTSVSLAGRWRPKKCLGYCKTIKKYIHMDGCDRVRGDMDFYEGSLFLDE